MKSPRPEYDIGSWYLPEAAILTEKVGDSELKGYLETFTKVLNRHTALLQNMNSTSEHSQVLSACLDRISEAATIPSLELLQLMPEMETDTAEFQKASTPLQEKLLKVESRLKVVGHALGYLHRRILERDEASDQIDKVKEEVLKKIADGQGKVDYRVHEMNEALNAHYKKTEERIKDIDVGALWKLTDCETLLKTKASEVFVHDAIKLAEARLTNEMKIHVKYEVEDVIALAKDLRIQVEEINEELKDRKETTAKMFVDLERMYLLSSDER
jgi:hypothetical protein